MLIITNLNYEKQEMVLLVMVADPAGVGYIFLILRLLWLRAFNYRFRLGWGVPPFFVAFVFSFSAHHNYRHYCILFKDIYYSYLPDL
jgi:hypothetical protein